MPPVEVTDALHCVVGDRERDVHETRVQVRFSEMDPYGHVNHVVYLAYLEQGRIDLLDHLGWGLDSMQEQGFGVVVVEVQIKYHSPASYGDILTVRTAIEELRRASSWWRQEIVRGDTLIASARVRGAMSDLTGRPARPPDGLFEDLLAYGEDVG